MSKKKKKKWYTKNTTIDIDTLIKNPRIQNKYDLTIPKIKNLKIGDTSKICTPLFWRNNVVNAWCISYESDQDSGNNLSYDSFWIGFYDNGNFEFYFTSYGDMCGYDFEEFYNPHEIEIIDDFLVQEKFLEKINLLIAEGILVL